MESIALTNTLIESKINIYDENSNLISSTNNQNNSINNNNSFNTNNSITSSNITEQITLRKNNNTNNSNNTNKKSNHHFHHHSKQKYNLPVEIIDYDNIEDNNNNNTHNSSSVDHFYNKNLPLHTSNSDLRKGELNITLLSSTIKTSSNNSLNMNNKMQQHQSGNRMVKPQNITTVSEINNNNNNSRLNSNNNNINSNVLPVMSSTQKLTSNGETCPSIKKQPAKVTSRIVFLKLGQVDTRNERYDAEAYIECSWEDDQIFKILADPNMTKNLQMPNGLENMVKQAMVTQLTTNNLVNLKNVINNINSLEYDTSIFWTPQLYIENAIGDIKEEIRHKLEIVEKEGSDLLNDPNFDAKQGQYKNVVNNLTVRVCEMRKLRGVFYERLELYDFPMDMQELSITLTSKRSVSEVIICENEKDSCSINTEDFLDQQEWDLFGHVNTSKKKIYDPWRKYDRTAFSVTCYIARKPGYYLYNAYMLIFLITVLGFVPFAFEVSGPQFRCQVTGLLLLTSVNFRWIVTQRLPSVPYLTSLDKYAIGSLFSLVLFCVWHSVIGSNVITRDTEKKQLIDNYVFMGAGIFYLLYNIGYITWFIKMARSIKKFHLNSLKQLQEAITKKKIELENEALLETTNNFNSNNNSSNNINNMNESSYDTSNNQDQQQNSNANSNMNMNMNRMSVNMKRVGGQQNQPVVSSNRKKTIVNPENISLFA